MKDISKFNLMVKKLIILFFITFLSGKVKAQKEYFQKYQTMADSLEKVYKIPSAVILAIAYYESGGGKSRAAKLLNNHFGIVGSNNLMQTHNIKSRYKYFEDVSLSYQAFCLLVSSRKYYTNVKDSGDNKKWVNAIASGGYAHSDKWTSKILSVINNYNLD